MDKGFHGRGGLRVGIFQTRDRGKDFGDTNENVRRGLGSDVNTVPLCLAIHLRGRAEGLSVAGRGYIDDMLDDGSVHHGEGRDDETKGDTGDGAEGNVEAAENGVDNHLQEWDEDDDGDGIEVLHEIVGDTMAIHLFSLGDKVTRELAVYHPIDRVEGKDLASDEGTFEFVNEVVIPWQVGATTTVSLLPAGLGGIQVAVNNHDPQGPEGVRDDRTLRRTNNVELPSHDKDNDTDNEHAQAEEISRPEADISFHERGGEQRQGANIDAAIEDHVDTLDSQSGVNDDTLTLCGGRYGQLLALVLIGNERSDVTLDTSSTHTDDQDRGDEASQTSVMLEGDRDRSKDQDEQTNHVDKSENNNGLVFAQVLVSDDGTEDGSDCRVISFCFFLPPPV